MPHKRNPVVCERISGLARVVRGHAQAALENVALWHERDISHSSAERIIVPDATGLLDFMLADAAWVLDGLVVFPDAMLENVMSHGGIAFSQSALLALVEAGMVARGRLPRRAAPPPPRPGTRAPASARRWRPTRWFARRSATTALEALFDPRAVPAQPRRRCSMRLEKLPVSEGRRRDHAPVACAREARCGMSTTPDRAPCSWSPPIASAPSTSCCPSPSPTRAGC